MSDDYKAILVTGSHRSGTTWVGKTLYQHKSVKYVYEPFNIDYDKGNMYLNLDTWFLNAPGSKEKKKIRNRFDRFFSSNSLIRSWQLCKISEQDYKFPLRFLKFLFVKSARPKTVIKDPIALLSAGWIDEHYPVKVICMVRGPLGFIGSVKKAGWDFDFSHFEKQDTLIREWMHPFKDQIYKINREGDYIERACLLWNMLHYAIFTYKQNKPHWLFVEYKEIALNPVEKFSQIFDYADLDMQKNIEKYIREYTSAINPKEPENHEYMPIDSKKSPENWKKRLTSEEIKKVKSLTKDVYTKLKEAGLVS